VVELTCPPLAISAISLWLALQSLDEGAHDGGLRLVNHADSTALGALCQAHPLTGRPLTAPGGGADALACARALDALSRAPPPLMAGDAILFRPDVWHRTSVSGAASRAQVRWTYVERWARGHTRRRVPARGAAAQDEDGAGAEGARRAAAAWPEPQPAQLLGLVQVSMSERLSEWLRAPERLSEWLSEWVPEYPMQPPCAHGLQPSEPVAHSPCYRTVRLSDQQVQVSDQRAPALPCPRARGGLGKALREGQSHAIDCASAQDERGVAPLWGMSAGARALGMSAYLLHPSRSLGSLRAWRVRFALTQLLELPVHLLFVPRLRPAPIARAIVAGAWASALTHPAACSIVHTTGHWLETLGPRWRTAAVLARWAVLEMLVIAVEARWLLRSHGGPRARAWAVSVAANAASIVGGWLLLRGH
jgi:hypothetical protein